MRRRALLAASKQGGESSIFPMRLYLTKVDNETYRHEPSPESIALADYILENGVFNGVANFDVPFEEGNLYIDDMEVRSIMFEYNGQYNMPAEGGFLWVPKKKYFTNEWTHFGLGWQYNKGLIELGDDD